MSHLVPALIAAAALAACAAAPPPPPIEWRVNLKLAMPADDAAAIAQEAASTAGVPARYVAAASREWHAVVLQCSTESACEAAAERLRAHTSRYAAVQRDERRRIVTP